MSKTTYEDSVTDVAPPSGSGDLSYYNKGGSPFARNNAGTIFDLGGDTDIKETNVLYVDLGTAVPIGSQNGDINLPFTTITQAIAALPVRNTSALVRAVDIIKIANGSYDEDLTIVLTNRNLVLSGVFNLGLFDNAFYQPSGTRRNITLSGDMDAIDGVRSGLLIATGINPVIELNENAFAAFYGPRISGQIISTMTSSAGTDTWHLGVQAQVFGTDGTSAGTSIDCSGDSSTAPVFLHLYSAHMEGKVDLGLGRLTDCSLSVCDAEMTMAFFGRADQSKFTGNWNVASATSGIGSPVNGFYDCTFTAAFTWDGLHDLYADAVTANNLTAAPVTISGGAVLVLTGALQVEDEGTPVANSVGLNFVGSGVSVAAGSTAADPSVVTIVAGGLPTRQEVYDNGQVTNVASGTGTYVTNASDAVAIETQKSGSPTIAQTTTGAVDITPTSGQEFTATTAGSADITMTAAGDMTLNSGASQGAVLNAGAGGTTELQLNGVPKVAITSAGRVNVTPTSGQNFDVTVLASGTVDIGTVDGIVSIDASNAEVRLSHAGGITKIQGDLVVEGTTTTVDSETVLIADNHLQLNAGYTTAAAQTGGIVVNYLPIATNTTVNGSYVAGVVSTSNPTVGTTGAATFAVGQYIQFSNASDDKNEGVYEVLTHAANVLTVRGIGLTATVEDFTQNQFKAGSSNGATISRVTLGVMRIGTDGIAEQGGAAVTPMTFNDIPDVFYVGTSASTGIISGGIVTINGGDPAKFDVAAGVAQFADATNPTAEPTRVNFGPFTAEDPLDLATTTFTVLSISPAGALVKQNTLESNTEKRLNAQLQDVSHFDLTTITSIDTEQQPAFGMAQASIDYIQLLGGINAGNQYTAAAADLTISKSAGTTDLPFLNGAFSATDPNHQVNAAADPTGFAQIYQDSGVPGGFNISFQTDVPAGLYDDGSDVLASVGANNWAIYWCDFSNNGTALTIGQVVYSTLVAAKAGVFTENPITVPAVANIPNTRRTAILVKGNATDLSDSAQAAFVAIVSAFGGSTSAVLSVNGEVGIVTLDASEIPFTPDGDIAAEDTQAAIVEVRDDTDTKLALKADKSIVLTAGAGLTGGGDLSAARTFDAVANADASIVVNANDIQVGILATDAQHGVRGGGTQHADVIAGGADGFMTGTDKTKLNGIEALADVTDATNVAAAGGILSGDTAGGDLGGTYPNPTVDDGADSTAIHDNVSGEINSITEKTAPIAADLLVMEDSASSNAKKKVQIGNFPIPPVTINVQTGTTYTLVDADIGKLVTCNNAATVTVDLDTGLVSGFWCLLRQLGAGQVVIAGTATLNNGSSHDATRAQYSAIGIMYQGTTNTYNLDGDSTEA